MQIIVSLLMELVKVELYKKWKIIKKRRIINFKNIKNLYKNGKNIYNMILK